MHYLPMLFMILGLILAAVGIYLFTIKGTEGKNRIKILQIEFELSGSSLVIFVVGILLIVFPIIYGDKFSQYINLESREGADENNYDNTYVIMHTDRDNNRQIYLSWGLFESEIDGQKKIKEKLKNHGDLTVIPTPDHVWHLMYTEDASTIKHQFYATKISCESGINLCHVENLLRTDDDDRYIIINVDCEDIKISKALNFVDLDNL